MKRIIIVFFLFIVVSNQISAQLLVDANGNVAVKPSNGSLNSYFSVNGDGSTDASVNIKSDSTNREMGLKITQTGGLIKTEALDCIARHSTNSNKMAYGVHSLAYKNSSIDSNYGRSYGVYSVAGNSTPGWNYGVFGTLLGSNNGAGIFGSSDTWDGGVNTGDRFAGYFRGKVKVTNTIEATDYLTSSDYRLKENIEPIESQSVDDIMKLNVVKYNLKQRFADTGDTTTTPVSYYTDDTNLLQKTHYGLIAQELQDIYPDLVFEGGDGYLSVNYIELIPILIQSIQSLKEEVDQLKFNQKTSKRTTALISTQNDKESAYVNRISVSDEVINITCEIPKSVKNARLWICDSNGIQVFENDIKDRGQIEIVIKNMALNDGIFVCSLVTDECTDTRRFYYGK
jgi:hypothetical protein